MQQEGSGGKEGQGTVRGNAGTAMATLTQAHSTSSTPVSSSVSERRFRWVRTVHRLSDGDRGATDFGASLLDILSSYLISVSPRPRASISTNGRISESADLVPLLH